MVRLCPVNSTFSASLIDVVSCSGALGLGDKYDKKKLINYPRQINELSGLGVFSVACGNMHTCVLTSKFRFSSCFQSC